MEQNAELTAGGVERQGMGCDAVSQHTMADDLALRGEALTAADCIICYSTFTFAPLYRKNRRNCDARRAELKRNTQRYNKHVMRQVAASIAEGSLTSSTVFLKENNISTAKNFRPKGVMKLAF